MPINLNHFGVLGALVNRGASTPPRNKRRIRGLAGGMAERLNAPVLKTGGASRPSWVRIPLPPPIPAWARRVTDLLWCIELHAAPPLRRSIFGAWRSG